MRPKNEVGLQMHYHGGVSEHMKNISIWPFKLGKLGVLFYLQPKPQRKSTKQNYAYNNY